MRQTTCGHSPHRAKGLCQKCYTPAYYAANKERIKAAAADWARENPDRRRAIAKKSKQAHHEQRLEQAREYYRDTAPARRAVTQAWRAANGETIRASRRASETLRRARRYGAGADLTERQWQGILAEFDYRCAYCSADTPPLEQEHMRPLSRGGQHTADNVVPACGPCNRSKHAKTVLEWVCRTP